MKLEKFKQLDNKKISIVIFTIVCVLLVAGVFLYRSFALFEVIENKNLIEGNVEDMGDISFTYYLDNNIVKDSPSKDSDYMFDDKNSSCSNNATVRWNYEDWGPVVGNLGSTKTKCHLKFTTNYHERILNGAYPVLEDALIPVTIEDNGVVRKADLNTEWYNYTNKKWANAIIKENSYDVLSRKGLVHGATKQDGYVSLDGVDDYIELGYANYDFGNKITVAASFSSGEPSNDVRTQIALANIDSSGIEIYYYEGKVRFAIFGQNNNGYITVESKTNIDLHKKYNVVGTYDGSTMKIYVNGKLDNELAIVDTIKVSPFPIVIGANPNLNELVEYSDIDVYQTAIYTRVLSSEEIASGFTDEIKIYNNEGLLSYVDFTNRSYEANEIIQEDNIESYFVWIPRYRYKIFNDGNYIGLTAVENRVQEIEVEFESKDTTPSTGTSAGSWLTHPAFTAFNTNGMWVGKFETGNTGTEENVRNANQIQIKPNVVSWRSIQVANAFYTSYDYKRNLESHMMKNTEWGAVAFLQHSAYGSQESIRINNNSSHLTGYAAVSEPTCGFTGTNEECNKYGITDDITQSYNTTIGYFASTTKNISGIYDMSGNSWEYVMGVMLDESGVPMSGRNSLYNSGFNGNLGCPSCDSDTSGITRITDGYEWPDKRYYDTYGYSTSDQHFERRILGDATGEMGPFGTAIYTGSNGNQARTIGSWYTDQPWFVLSSYPWFVRGSTHYDGLNAGAFAFNNKLGSGLASVSFRLVLSPGGTK